MLKTLDQLKTFHIELTTRCNARCPMCVRNYRGYEYNSGYPVCELSVEDIEKIFTPEVIAQLNSRSVNFNGNLGDFSNARDSVEIVKFFIDRGFRIDINTNGSARSTDWWSQLAMPGVSIGFALDGLADTHSLYRQDTDWHKVIENAQAYISAGGVAVWRFVPFDHNQHQEQACKDMARAMGFKRFENIYDGRDRGPVYARDGSFSHWLGPAEAQVPALKDMLQSHVTWFRAETVDSPKDMPDITYNCQHKRAQEIYIAADGSVYPCCYLGFYPGQMTHPGNEQLLPLVRENNALEYGLEHSMAWFDSVEDTWSRSSIRDGRLYQCVNSCGAAR
jgi:MoaA/NifB/PqqE/SkfB family radical SAM enzyme